MRLRSFISGNIFFQFSVWCLCGAANEYSCTHGAHINFGALTPYLTYGYSAVRVIYHPSFDVNYRLVFHSIASLFPLDENSNTEHHRLNLSSSPEAGCTDTEDERSPKRKFTLKSVAKT